MATSLRDIPGAAKRRRPGGRRSRDSWHRLEETPRPAILHDPRQSLVGTAVGGRRRGTGMFDRRRGPRLSAFDTVLVLAVLAVALFLLRGLWSATRVDVDTIGLERTDYLTAGEARNLDVRIKVSPATNLPSAVLTLNGEPLEEAEVLDDGYRWKPDQAFTPGVHRLELTVPRPVLPESRFVWEFTVDARPPEIQAPRVLEPHGMDEPVTIRGTVDDPDATITALGEPVEVADDGSFAIEYERPPAGPIKLLVADPAGHKVRREIFVPVKRPNVRGVHMSAISWRTKSLRDEVFRLIDEGKINTVQLDLKDEGGEIGYDSTHPLATRIGAARGYYDLEEAVAELHRRGVRVVGRVVAFRDPILAQAAWQEGKRDWVVQRPDGSMHGAYGGFTNFANREVQQYNLDIAAEGAAAGMDEILWDYIRRPESGKDETVESLVFPGIDSTDVAVQRSVVNFLARSHELLRAKGVFQGASVFGIAAGDPISVGQHVPSISKHVDYLAPMVYPSLWGPLQYRVADPVREPYTIVYRSLADFQKKAEGTGVDFTPWLQDFSLGATYGAREVKEQIKAAADLGVDEWLLWSPRVRYHDDLLDRIRD